MARRLPVERTHRGFNTGAAPTAAMPTACPVCGETPVVAKGEKRHQVLEAHLMAQHRPDVACQRAHRSDGAPAWRLDWDAVLNQQTALWFCNECGYYHQAD
jgi:hypothetical protein